MRRSMRTPSLLRPTVNAVVGLVRVGQVALGVVVARPRATTPRAASGWLQRTEVWRQQASGAKKPLAGVLSLDGAVSELKRVKPMGPTAAVTRSVIADTLALLDEKARLGETSSDFAQRRTRGEQQALVVLSMLVDEKQHFGQMTQLNSDSLRTDKTGAAFKTFLEGLCFTDKGGAMGLLRQASRNSFDVMEFEALIPKERANIIVLLTERNLLVVNKAFGNRRVWSLSHDSGPLRHIYVALLEDATVTAIRKIMDAGKAAVVCGESGSGKTMSSIFSSGETGLCITILASDLFGTANEDAVHARLEKEAELERTHRKGQANAGVGTRSTYMCQMLKAMIEQVVPSVGEPFDGRVVLVVDEVGNHPLFVKALCREAKNIVAMLKETLKLTGNVGVVVCGTGSEVGDDMIGSYADTYAVISCEHEAFTKHVTDLMDEHGLKSLVGMLRSEPFLPSYFPVKKMKTLSVAYIRRLLTNRRIAAAFLGHVIRMFPTQLTPKNEVTEHIDATVPWATVLPCLTNAALIEYKALNGLSGHPFSALRMVFADALAVCFGGHMQPQCTVAKTLNRNLGILRDNARTVKKAAVKSGDLEVSKGNGSVLVVASGKFGRRFAMGPAMLEMGLQGFALSTAARARSGEGFEYTMADFMYCWALACCSKVIITLPSPRSNAQAKDATLDLEAQQELLKMMTSVRDVIKAKKVLVVLRARLTTQARTVDEAVNAAFDEAINMIVEDHNVGKSRDVPFVIVVTNAPKAPFADVFVVGGSTSKRNKPTMFVALQAKHYTKMMLTPINALHEHLKHGCPVFRTDRGQELAADMALKTPTLDYDALRKELKSCTLPPSPYPFVSLVLVVHLDTHKYSDAALPVESFAGMTTIRIRSGVLRSVLHPIPLGTDAEANPRLPPSDCEKTDLRDLPHS